MKPIVERGIFLNLSWEIMDCTKKETKSLLTENKQEISEISLER
jgi:hypothetical protein